MGTKTAMGTNGTKRKDPNMSTSNFSHLIFDKETKNTHGGIRNHLLNSSENIG